MPLQRNDKVKITQPGRYFGREGHIVKPAGYQYAAHIVAFKDAKGFFYETIQNIYLQPVQSGLTLNDS